jgi:hypothetical protein
LGGYIYPKATNASESILMQLRGILANCGNRAEDSEVIHLPPLKLSRTTTERKFRFHTEISTGNRTKCPQIVVGSIRNTKMIWCLTRKLPGVLALHFPCLPAQCAETLLPRLPMHLVPPNPFICRGVPFVQLLPSYQPLRAGPKRASSSRPASSIFALYSASSN